MTRRNLIRLIDKYLAGNATPDERAIIEAWLDSKGSNLTPCSPFTDEELKQIEQTLFSSIQRNIEELRSQRYSANLINKSSIDLVKHPSLNDPQVRPFLSAEDVCFHPMIEYLSSTHRQTLIWSQLDKLSIRELAIKLHLTTTGARSRLQRAQEQLNKLIRRCCTYQYDDTGKALACLISASPGCC